MFTLPSPGGFAATNAQRPPCGPSPRRIRLHQQVARALETIYGRRVEEHAAELAEHFSYSSDPENLRKAVDYGRRAAQRAMGVYAYGEAVRHLEQALKVQAGLDPDDAATRCDLLLALAAAQRPAGDAQRVVDETAPQAYALAEVLQDQDRAWQAASIALLSLTTLSAAPGAPRYGGQAVAEWIERADRSAGAGTVQRCLADARKASTWWAAGRYEEAWALAARAAALARRLHERQAILAAEGSALNWVALPRFERRRLALAQELQPLLQWRRRGRGGNRVGPDG